MRKEIENPPVSIFFYYLYRILLCAVTLFCVLVLVGWLLDIEVLKHPYAGIVAMNPLTAFCFILLSVSVFIIKQAGKNYPLMFFVLFLISFVLVVCTMRIINDIGWIDFSLDGWVFKSKLLLTPYHGLPNKMATNTATAFLFFSFSVIAYILKNIVISQVLIFSVFFFSLLTVVGYGFGVPEFYSAASYYPMAIYTGLCFMLMSASFIMLQSEGGIMKIVSSYYPEGKISRILFPAVLIFPTLGGYFVQKVVTGLEFSSSFGMAIFTVILVGLFGIVCWIMVKIVYHSNNSLRMEVAEKEEAQRLTKAYSDTVMDLYENAPCGYHSLNGEGYFIEVNKTELEWLGYSREELLGKTRFSDILTEQSKRKFSLEFPKFIETGELKDVEFELIKRDGTILHVLLSASAVYDDSGNFIKSRSTVFDYTERKMLNDKLNFFNKELEEEVERRTEVIVRNKKRFRNLVENSADGIFVLQGDGLINYVSPSVTTMLHFSAHELLGKNFMDQLGDKDKNIMISALGKSESNPGVPQEGVRVNFINGEGALRVLDCRLTSFIHDEHINGIICNCSDITEKARLEEEQVVHLRNTDALMNSTNDMMWIVDTQYRFVVGNRSFLHSIFRSTGLNIQQGDDLLIEKYYPSTLLKLWKSMYDECMMGNFLVREVQSDYSPKNEREWLEIQFHPIRDHNGHITGAACYARDVSLNKEKERLILETNERLRLAQKMASIGYWELDLDLNTSVVTSGTYELFGLNPDGVPPHLDMIVSKIVPGDRDAFLKTYSESFKHKEDFTSEFLVEKKEGVLCYLSARGSFMADPVKGQKLEIVFQDISVRKEHENQLSILNKELLGQTEELKSSNAELEQFAYIASHDLQEPLRMVTGFLSQLEKKYKNQLDDKAQQYIHFATDGALRMRKLILDLLDYSRIGRKEFQIEWVDIEGIVNEWKRFNQDEIMQKHVQLTFTSLPKIKGNVTSLAQLFQNLLGNALKYQADGNHPKIEVTCEERFDSWLFGISDNGIGIESRYFEKIFMAFQRLHNRNEFSGTGIGLAICKKIVEQHQGRIWVESEPQKGSTFYFTIKKM